MVIPLYKHPNNLKDYQHICVIRIMMVVRENCTAIVSIYLAILKKRSLKSSIYSPWILSKTMKLSSNCYLLIMAIAPHPFFVFPGLWSFNECPSNELKKNITFTLRRRLCAISMCSLLLLFTFRPFCWYKFFLSNIDHSLVKWRYSKTEEHFHSTQALLVLFCKMLIYLLWQSLVSSILALCLWLAPTK